MLDYYLRLALVSFRRHWLLTALMVVAIAVGVAMTMTAYTVLDVMSRDPIPEKSHELFAVQLDNGGPRSRKPGDDELPAQLTYRDAMAFLKARVAKHQVAMHQIELRVMPADPAQKPYSIVGRATSADFFGMFEVPMLYGHGWSESHDADGASVVVLSKKLNERLFAGANSIGRSMDLSGARYQVIGVTDQWDPKPRFYDVIGGQNFDEGEDAFLPLSLTVDQKMPTSEYEYCDAGPPGETFDDLLRSECVWLQFWVELPTRSDVAGYQDFLNNYARVQQQSGRFTWAPNTRLRNVRDWLIAQKVVPNDARLSVLVAFGFLTVCLVSASGLMLAKDFSRAAEFGVRRALGASGRHIFAQNIIESGVIGVFGGTCGVLLTLLALWALRALFPGGMGRIAQLDAPLFAATLTLAVVATLLTGFYPAWHSMRVNPALQIKGGS
jgi:putative ABC transport system permease protein